MAEEKKEKPLNELLTSRILDVYVGSENTHWPLHEKLLCYYSPAIASKIYSKDAQDRPGQNKSFGLPEEEGYTFQMLVSWLYSRKLDKPVEEKDIGPLLDLYLLADKLEMDKLSQDIVDLVRQFYHDQNAYPGLRRVQYIYANTEDDNAMREMMVSSIARFLALGDSIPSHWNKALRKNGELAVDIIRAIQEWHLEGRTVPDAREGSLERGRVAFSKIENHTEGSSQVDADTNADATSGQGEEQEEGEGEEEEEEEEEAEELSTPTTSTTLIPSSPSSPTFPPPSKRRTGKRRPPDDNDSPPPPPTPPRPKSRWHLQRLLPRTNIKSLDDADDNEPKTPLHHDKLYGLGLRHHIVQTNHRDFSWEYVLLFMFWISQLGFVIFALGRDRVTGVI